ncbi:MAG: TonB-dependent receptor plug domain-containing protein, partial [Candidatus Rokuibacteriota bacterium]
MSEAANPIVPRDQVSSKGIIAGDLVANLPVDNVRAVLSLTPGVLETGAGDGVSIRGGRPGEANVYIDGAPVRSTNFGGDFGAMNGLGLGTNALEEASVTTGALGVEFSDAQSGLISYTTRAGGEQIAGAVSLATDEPMGNGLSVGFNRIEGSIGGPIPGVQNLRWFVSGVGQGQTTRFRGKGSEDVPFFTRAGIDLAMQLPTDPGGALATDVILPKFAQVQGECGNLNGSLPDTSALAQQINGNYGFDCGGLLRPMDWQTTMNYQGKLQYGYGQGSSVSLTALIDDFKERFAPFQSVNNPAQYQGHHDWSRKAILNLSHQVSRSAERALAVNLNVSWQRDRHIQGSVDPATETDSRSPTGGFYLGGMEFSGLQNFPFPITDQIVRDLRTNSGTRGLPPGLFGRSDLETAQSSRNNPYGATGAGNFGGWNTHGIAVAASTLEETRYTGRVVVDWQANRFHRFTLGGDLKKTDLAWWSVGDLTNQIFMDAYVVDPIQYGVFASDRLDLGDVVLELGVRWDYYKSNALFANTPGRISSVDSATVPLAERKWNPAGATDDTA